jgi:DNA-binding transcriptional MerR regulator
MRLGLSIGDLSRITHLSVKTLRHYHEAGLLQPANVDPGTGYRYYSTAQVPNAQVIRRFRDLGMPVREVADLLLADPAQRAALITAHLQRLEDQLDQTRAAVGTLRRLLEPAPASIEVELRAVPTFTAAAVRATVDLSDVLRWYATAMAELDRTLCARRLTPTGPCGGLYDNALFTDEHGHVTVYVPLPEPPRAGAVEPITVPAVDRSNGSNRPSESVVHTDVRPPSRKPVILDRFMSSVER